MPSQRGEILPPAPEVGNKISNVVRLSWTLALARQAFMARWPGLPWDGSPRALTAHPIANSAMTRLRLASSMLLLLLCPAAARPLAAAEDAAPRPNIVFILADDLGYGDLGCQGQQLIQTPRLDQMAREGMRFDQFYAGCTVCAPSRCVLMTGMHMGHAHVRGNAGRDMSVQSLRDEDVTVAEVLRGAGYATALCGKWGLGDAIPGNTGLPNDQGFDHFFGYLNQVHAHNYYPEFLWRDRERVPLRNKVVAAAGDSGGFRGGHAVERVDYSHDLVIDDALAWLREHHERPFFLYVALTIPHANNEGTRATGNGQEVPDFGPYADRDWPDPDKGQAAMITRMDRDVGRLLDLLGELGIDQRTLVMFSSDNGPHDEGGHSTERFQPAGPLRGMKRDLYEGGIRVPMLARWPGTTPAGVVSHHIGYFGDLLATAAELAGVAPPTPNDSLSLAPTLTGQGEQREHDYLYWEFYERQGAQAIRRGPWKGIRKPMLRGPLELYDLDADLGERQDVAAKHPDIVRELEQRMGEAHRPHPNWAAR